jgi:putative phage-type endonuclease
MKTKIMQALVLADRKGLTKEQWLEIRKQGIGGSDAGAICGLNPFSTPFTVYGEKLGILPPKEETEAMRIGTDLEDYIAKRFTEKTGKKVVNCNYVLKHKSYSFMLGDVDRLIVGERAGLECKSTSPFNKTDFEKADIPPQWYTQCVHYMAVTGAEKWYLAVLVLGQGFYVFEIERNEDEINALIKLEKEFWFDNVMANVEPDPDGRPETTDVIKSLYTANKGEEIDLMPYRDLLDRYTQIKDQINALKQDQELIKQELQIYMAMATDGFAEGYKVLWREQVTNRLDTDRLKKERPDIYNAYMKKSIIRPFKVDKKELK